MRIEHLPEPLHFFPRTDCNAMTVDVEEYFQVSAFEQHIDSRRWPSIPSRLQGSIEKILALFDSMDVHATFFTLGWVAERHPAIIRRISDAGHEIASHGMRHVRVINQDRATFRADVTRSRAILEDITGRPVIGYRAASYSIGADNLWALDVLGEAGFRYSSSVYPIRHDLYGIPGGPRFPFRREPGGLLEVPVTTVEVAGGRYPCGGGGFFRLYPYALSRWAIRRVNRRDRSPAVFYFHPWEVDPDQPRLQGLGWKTRFRHYCNLERTQPRLRRMLADFHWDRMDHVFPVGSSQAGGQDAPMRVGQGG